MPTQTERKSAQAKLAAFGKALAKTDFDGDVYDAYKVGTFIDENPDIFEPGTKDLYLKNIKALTAEISPDGTQCLVSMESGEASMDEDPEAVPPEEAKRLKIRLDKQDRKLEELSEKMRRDTQLRNTPRAELKLPGAEHWERRKAKGINTFVSPEQAAAFACHVITGDDRFRKQMPTLFSAATKAMGELGQKGNATSPLTAGGALMAEEFDVRLIDRLSEYEYSAASKLEQVRMNEDVVKRPRATNELDVYYPGEGGTPTYTQLATDRVTLSAKKAMALVEVTNELKDGSFVNIGEKIAAKLVQGFAKKSDSNLFLGDGTATYGGMVGLNTIFGSTATADARSVTGGGTADAHTLANLYNVLALLDDIYLENAAWYCTSVMKAIIFQRLAGSVGGLGMEEIAGKQVDTFLGYPIYTNRIMNNSIDASGDAVDVYFGDFSKLGMHGLRKDVDVATSEEVAFTTDEVVMRGVFRHDINLYDTGSTSEAGAVIALYQT